MPNAQTHLLAAAQLLASDGVANRLPWLRQGEPQAAFLLGVISPDVRAITGQSREATHFFEIPPRDSRPVQLAMFGQWPRLQDAPALNPPQAAFIAGYVAHLIMDVTWVERIVMPCLFIEDQPWGASHPNWRLYSILMSYMEYQAVDQLPEGTLARMEQARPAGGWLPFVEDSDLAKWRNQMAGLIRRGGARLVSRYFAISNHMQSEQMEAIVTSESRMAEEAYSTVPRERLDDFLDESARRSGVFVLDYLAAITSS
jgi:hypothetical protein